MTPRDFGLVDRNDHFTMQALYAAWVLVMTCRDFIFCPVCGQDTCPADANGVFYDSHATHEPWCALKWAIDDFGISESDEW